MSFVIGIKIETVNPKKRDELLKALLDLVSEEEPDSTTITLSHEIKTARGKRKVQDTITFGPGEDIPHLTDFGVAKETPMEREIRLAPARTI
jgi:hypothetical protein